MHLSSFVSTLVIICISLNLCVADDIVCPSNPPVAYLNTSVFTNIMNEVDEYIKTTIMEQNNITGFITTIVYDQQVLFSKGYGLSNYLNKSSLPPNGDNLVMIASNTKLFTSLLLYYLRDNNYNVSLYDPIKKYLPLFSIKSIYSTNKQLTLKGLVTHSTGLQSETPYPYTDVSDNETAILNELSNKYLLFEQYSRFHYSNLGFSLLGRSLEKLFCEYGCYEEYVKKFILNGLNFSIYSGFNYSDYIINNYCVNGWYIDDNGNRQTAPIETSYFDNPNGAMLATPNDMAKYMMFIFRDNMTTHEYPFQILDGMTIKEMLSPQILLNDGLESIGNPFEMHYHTFNTLHSNNKISGVWYKGKQGEVLGYRSSTMMIPDYKLGVFTVALEDPSDISEGSVWSNNILDMILPELDYLLYMNYLYNIKYNLPSNWKLLTGEYININNQNDIIYITYINNEEMSKQYLLVQTPKGTEKKTLQLLTDGVMDVFKLYDDNGDNPPKISTEETCFWNDGVYELMYFNFSNGNDSHVASFLYNENKYIYK